MTFITFGDSKEWFQAQEGDRVGWGSGLHPLARDVICHPGGGIGKHQGMVVLISFASREQLQCVL